MESNRKDRSQKWNELRSPGELAELKKATRILEGVEMKVVLYGATGNAGERILKELLGRGHKVTAVVRDQTKIQSQKELTLQSGDLSDSSKIAKAVEGADAVVSAYGPGLNTPNDLVGVTERLVAGVKQSGVARLLTVGGAGTLEVSPGVLLLDSTMLPAEWKPIAKAHLDALQILRASDLDWTCLAPAAFFEPGNRTGVFRLGLNNLIVNEKGESKISMEDYAIALVDELEKHAHPRQRFSVGY
jgi:putative NADH-flavin reductase